MDKFPDDYEDSWDKEYVYEFPKEFTKEIDDDRFHIGQEYEGHFCKSLCCSKCGGFEFFVGTGSYYTAIKCVKCLWETCIHSG